MQSVESQPTFRRNIPPPSSESKNKPSKIKQRERWQEGPHFHADFLLGDVSPKRRLAAWRYIPEDSTLHNHSCEKLKSYMTTKLLSFILSIITAINLKSDVNSRKLLHF
jgi:hypothetical protein